MKKAVALRYDPAFHAPFIAASGTGRNARRIEELAALHGIPVVKDDALAGALIPLDAGSFVPPEYWELVARVLVIISSVH